MLLEISNSAESIQNGRMKAVLDEAAAMIPDAKCTSAMKAEIASHILASATRGERDPVALRNAALSAVVERSHYSHDVSPERDPSDNNSPNAAEARRLISA